MSRWFRLYAEVLDDPKVQRLSGDDFKAWINVLCLAARQDGTLPCASDIGFALRLDARKAAAMVGRLVAAGLLTATETGYVPHAWNDRQYKSDVSTGRVKRFRQRSKEQGETVPETPPDTEAETDVSVAKATGDDAPDPDKLFWSSAKAYLGAGKASKIGQWARDFGKDRTASAIAAAQVERAVDPIAYIEKTLRRQNGNAKDAWVSPC